MLQPLLDSTTFPLLEKAAVFGERRQQVLAGNIANIDTPNYKTRDLPVADFQRALKDAVAARQQPRSLGTTSPAGSTPPRDPFPEELFQASEAPSQNITFHDAGNRSIEHEVMEMTKNAMMQNFSIELMTVQMNLLQTVISERT